MKANIIPAVAGTSITVTSTATLLTTLIATASSTSTNFDESLNAVDLYVETGGNIRILYDGNTPTTSVGVLIVKGTMLFLRKIDVHKLKLIATSGNVTCNVQVGVASEGETTTGFWNGTT